MLKEVSQVISDQMTRPYSVQQSRMPRRAFLWAFMAGGICLPGLTPMNLAAERCLAQYELLLEAALNLFRDRKTARDVGQAYLSASPSEGLLEILTDLDASVSAQISAYNECSIQQLGDRLIWSVRDDFAEGRTVELDGWILSRTETRLCILSYLA